MSTPEEPKPDQDRLDPSVVAALFVEHHDELRRFLIGVLRNQEQANDVLQITFAKVVERGHAVREESQKGWLFRVAFNEAIALKRHLAVQVKSAGEVAARSLREILTPDAHATHWETVQQVRSALTQLPAEQRQVVQMRIYDEKKFATIAEELKLPLGTVLTRMHLALKKLKKILDAEHGNR